MSTTSSKTYKILLFTSLALTICALAFYAWLFNIKKSVPLPILGKVGAFELSDSNGKSFAQGQLDGKVWVANFIFTTCAGPCPIMTRNLASIYRSYLLERNVHFVSFTVNPQYDSPSVLTEYAKAQKADTSRWHFLTGTPETLNRLAIDDFKIGSKENLINHSTFFALVDGEFNIRGYYDGTLDAGVKKLFQDISRLMKESRK